MRFANLLAFSVALALTGCHSSNGNNIIIPDGGHGGDGGSGGDAGEHGDGGNPFHGDMSGPIDAGPPPAPTTKLVSPMGTAAGLVTSSDGTHALYLASPQAATAPSQQNPSGSPAYGTLHLTDASGNDATVGSGPVALGGYRFTPDGKNVIYGVTAAPYLLADLEIAPVATPTMATKLVSSAYVNGPEIGSNSFFSPDGRYYVFGDTDQGLNRSESLLVADTGASPPAVVFEMKNGAFSGVEAFQNGVMYFTAISNTSPPVQTLYSLPLKGLTTSTMPATIVQHVSSFTASADGTAIYYLTTSGDLFSQPVDTSGAKGSPTQITPVSAGGLAPPAAAQYAVQPCSAEPCRVAWSGSDGALHVSVGKTEIYKTAAKTVDVESFLAFTSDGSVYFFQYVKSQELRGILYFADLSGASNTTAATTTSTPAAVFGTVTGVDDTSYDSKAAYLYDVANLGGSAFMAQENLPAATSPFGPQFGPLVVSGSPVTQIAMGVPFGDVHFGYALALLENAAADTAAPARITGGGDYAGGLATTNLAGPATSVMATSSDVVAAGNYAWSDDSFRLLFIESVPASGAPPFDTTAMNYKGTLHVFDAAGKTGDHPVTITGASSNDIATEIGPVVNRTAFFIATSGVYYLTY